MPLPFVGPGAGVSTWPLGLSGSGPVLDQGGGGAAPVADLWFANGAYAGDTLANSLSTVRASVGYATTKAGALVAFGAGQPRITDQGLLQEEAATNLVIQSNMGAGWAGVRATLTAASLTAPDGTLTAAKLIETAVAGTHELVAPSFAVAVGQTHTITGFVARLPGAPRGIQFFVFNGDFSKQAAFIFDFANGTCAGIPGGTTLTVLSTTIRAYGPFWRIAVTLNSDATAAFIMDATLTSGEGAAATNSYTGDGVSGLGFWGWQCEQKTFATSPILTTTVAVTRAADDLSLGGVANAAIAAATGTIVAIVGDLDGFNTDARVLDSNGANLLGFTSANVAAASITSGLATANLGLRIIGRDCLALSWDAAGRRLVMNGGAAVADAVAQTPSATLKLGSTGVALNGYIQRLTVYAAKLATPEATFPLVKGSDIFGINISGAEIPAYVFPTPADWAKMASYGVKKFRLPCAHENFQTALNGALAPLFVAGVIGAIDGAHAVGGKIRVVIHNFAHYADNTVWGVSVFYAGNAATTTAHCFQLNTGSYPISALVDLITKMGVALAGHAPDEIELMNEPANMADATSWPLAAAAAYAAARTAFPSAKIIIDGNGSTGFTGTNGSNWVSPKVIGAANFAYSPHQYDDGPQGIGNGGLYSGDFTSYAVNVYTGVQSIQGVFGFGQQNGFAMDLGELNVPNRVTDNDPQWLVDQALKLALCAYFGVPAYLWSWSLTGGGGDPLNIAPQAGVEDPRLVTAMGLF